MSAAYTKSAADDAVNIPQAAAEHGKGYGDWDGRRSDGEGGRSQRSVNGAILCPLHGKAGQDVDHQTQDAGQGDGQRWCLSGEQTEVRLQTSHTPDVDRGQHEAEGISSLPALWAATRTAPTWDTVPCS